MDSSLTPWWQLLVILDPPWSISTCNRCTDTTCFSKTGGYIVTRLQNRGRAGAGGSVLSTYGAVLYRETQASVVRYAARVLLLNGGIVLKMENLGDRELMYPISNAKFQSAHTRARIFLFDCVVQSALLDPLIKELYRNTDIARPVFVRTSLPRLKVRHNPATLMKSCVENKLKGIPKVLGVNKPF